MANACKHLDQIKTTNAKTQGCEECLATGGSWVQLRLCLGCGHVGCCDSSPGKHATAHYHSTQHAVMREFPKASWGWCYMEELALPAEAVAAAR
jgi:uncharacterized UBP type Zn finger protein